ncbi:MAG TPA: hypothetical protein DEB17_03135 [Chlorobaculum sp.]|jgi:hypothetical protein|uniref:Uncharacterized protein n=1 Tax=Chlorobaculum tepidum (strain ATCC 49652 / DSM 12025 / NBRC 103806 / TLS) TaxID=194439 RepID=Q8KE64_CHLTE|nr:hypothetical protein [Chlorobaculum tepidum]AAM72062.1 hypothetical protein CT0826 [Chlorobaculum tepidum TLS]HBU22980.1 hypothetical protein [Chlorobaculum sp.]
MLLTFPGKLENLNRIDRKIAAMALAFRPAWRHMIQPTLFRRKLKTLPV